ncbi:hypothetical protein Saso_16970 [Streptomyces asoensis]|uniref:Uncharacterized protein n=1 Tax=Streptomyces asoensis TaxID=249586 RepID=A0ABQ3RWA3_9ACTN|nr:hypothetical protein GCM10010496_36000 [Streptomyces asoensis]GHI60047.1 hypothetical protein Saso_16970 [Streptomyces asoensis]
MSPTPGTGAEGPGPKGEGRTGRYGYRRRSSPRPADRQPTADFSRHRVAVALSPVTAGNGARFHSDK